jgi:hypothetical protein
MLREVLMEENQGLPPPFLFRFRKQCQSPRRSTLSNLVDGRFKYDHVRDQVLVLEGDNWNVAICQNSQLPATKKADYEKGEDAKDNWMWK